MKNLVIASIQLYFLVTIFLVKTTTTITSAFVVVDSHEALPCLVGTTTCRFLHPNQAADLEACAYDLMKAHVKAKKEEMTLLRQQQQCPCQPNGNNHNWWVRRMAFWSRKK